MKALNFLFSTFLIATSLTAYSCDCIVINDSTATYGFQNSDAVFVGTVIAIDTITENDKIIRDPDFNIPLNVDYYLFTFLMEKTYKGKLEHYKTFIIKVFPNNCGYPFIKKKKYIVYANKQKNEKLFTTNICTRTCLYNAKEIEALDKLTN